MDIKPAARRVIGYVRVSSTDQAREGFSLDAQAARIRSYCDTYDLHLIDVVRDAGVSAGTLERDGLKLALALLDEGRAAGLVVAKLDRLTRSVRDLGELLAAGAGERYELHSVADRIDTATATGRMMLNLLVTVSQWERERGGERTSEILQHLKAKGKHLGRAPFGWRRYDCGKCVGDAPKCGECGKLEPEPAEQDELARMIARRADDESLERIAHDLNTRGVVGRLGGAWTATAVRRALARAA